LQASPEASMKSSGTLQPKRLQGIKSPTHSLASVP
jgi:hypothetical protein